MVLLISKRGRRCWGEHHAKGGWGRGNESSPDGNEWEGPQMVVRGRSEMWWLRKWGQRSGGGAAKAELGSVAKSKEGLDIGYLGPFSIVLTRGV